MLYYMGMPDIQLLLLSLAMVLLMAGTLSIYIPRHTIVSAVAMLLIFFLGYHTIMSSTAVTGKPSFDQSRLEGVLGGYLGFRHDGEVYIAVLLNTSTGPELIAMPYTESDNKMLQEGMKKWIEQGIPQLVSGKKSKKQDGESESHEQGNGGGDGQADGALEVYDFAQDHLPAKQQ